MANKPSRGAPPPLRDPQSAELAHTGGVDPLVELARLIEQDESFGAVDRKGNPPERPAKLSVTRERPVTFKSAHRGPTEPGSEAPPQFPAEHDYQDEEEYAGDLPDDRRGLRIFVPLIGLLLVCSASAFAYWLWSGGLAHNDEAPVIRASTTPPDTTTRPPLGDDISSYERLHSKADEGMAKEAGRTFAGGESRTDTKPAAAPGASPPTSSVYGPAPTQAAGPPPGTAPPRSLAGPPPTPAPQSSNEGTPAPAPIVLGAPAPAVEPSEAHENRYIVQLSSQRSEAAAQATSRTLQAKYSELLSGHPPFIRRSDLRDRGVYYRVQVGPFSTIGEANLLCSNLKKVGADCVVQKN